MDKKPDLENSAVDMHTIEKVIKRIIPSRPLHIEPTQGGTSTSVYRINYPNEIFYLRLLPNAQDSFAAEAAIHIQLRQKNVKVPEVIHMEHFNEELQRSIMITTAIEGQPLIHSHTLDTDTLQTIVTEAGQDLASINTVAVDGFGWLRGQTRITQLTAPYASHRTFILDNWDNAVRYLASTILTTNEICLLEQLLVRYDSWLESEKGCLAHGDFSCRHIFHKDGRYTGIIDFGDGRGTDSWYDPGYFHMRDGGPLLPIRLEPALLQGYKNIISLPDDYESRIRFTSILITVKALATTLQQSSPDRFTQHQLQTLRRDIALLA